jgi:hypothetical protein
LRGRETEKEKEKEEEEEWGLRGVETGESGGGKESANGGEEKQPNRCARTPLQVLDTRGPSLMRKLN